MMLTSFVFSLTLFCNLIFFGKSVPEDHYRKIENVVASYGYPFEKHLIETEDGYSVEIHRIPGGKGENVSQTFIKKPPVYLLHGLTQTSADWVSVGPQISLAFLLADEGFDVWLGNCRGNLFGRNHKIYLETSYGFWNYSWHEIGIYDMPATIDLILKKTGKSQVYFVCYSQGCTASLVMGAMKPNYNSKIRLAAKMAPVAYVGHIQGVGGVWLPGITKFFVPLLEAYGHIDLTTSSLITILLTNLLKSPVLEHLFYKLVHAVFGPIYTSNVKAAFTMDAPFLLGGISSKQILHYGLGVLNPNTFRQYDYGTVENLKVYNSPTPPDYPLEKVTMPLVIFLGKNDFLVDTADVKLLIQKLPNVVKSIKKPLSHIDFGYNRNIRSLVYTEMVELFKKSEKITNN